MALVRLRQLVGAILYLLYMIGPIRANNFPKQHARQSNF